MQSETHEILYRSLADITDRINGAIEEDDVRTIIGLDEEHRDVMDSIKRVGLGLDIGLLHQVKETLDQVHEVISKIKKQRDELGRQLMGFERKKKVSSAYAGNRFSVMAVI